MKRWRLKQWTITPSAHNTRDALHKIKNKDRTHLQEQEDGFHKEAVPSFLLRHVASRSLIFGGSLWLTNRTNIKYLHRYLAVCAHTSKCHLVLCRNSFRMDFLSVVCVGCEGTLLSRYSSSILMHFRKVASKVSRNDIFVVLWMDPEKLLHHDRIRPL